MSTDVETYYDNELLSHRSCCNKRRHRSADDTLLLNTSSAASSPHSVLAAIISTAHSSQRQYNQQLMLPQLLSAVQQSVTHTDDGLWRNSSVSSRTYQQQVCRSAELSSHPYRVIIPPPHTAHCQLSIQTDTATAHISTPTRTNRPDTMLNLKAPQTLSEERKVPNATKHIIVDCEESEIKTICDYSPADSCYSNLGFTGEPFESVVFH